MANEQNLMPIEEVNSRRTREQHSEDSRRAGKASGEARRAKATFKKAIKAMMEEEAPEKIRLAFQKNGYDPTTHREAITAAILMGAMQGNAKMVDKVLELAGEDYRAEARKQEVKMAKDKQKMEKEKLAIEKAKADAYIEAIRQQQEAEMEDDGFLDALKGTATEDWDENS